MKKYFGAEIRKKVREHDLTPARPYESLIPGSAPVPITETVNAPLAGEPSKD